jgi:hypothetical protein
MWFLEQLETRPPRYAMTVCLWLRGALEEAVFDRCVDELVERREVFCRPMRDELRLTGVGSAVCPTLRSF